MLTFMFSASQSQGASVTKEPALHYQGASVTQEPFRYSLFLEEVLTSRSIFGTLRGNWWHFLVLYTSPVYPLSVWCFGEVEKSFFLGITEMLSCNAMAPALSGGHCVTYCTVLTFCATVAGKSQTTITFRAAVAPTKPPTKAFKTSQELRMLSTVTPKSLQDCRCNCQNGKKLSKKV